MTKPLHMAIRRISDILPGDHLCQIYETEEEHQSVIAPFLRAGLERNEKVLYFVDSRTDKMILDVLRSDGVDIDRYVHTGQFAVQTVADAYMKGGVFDPDRMIALLSEETTHACNEGYSALRVTGEMSWVLRGLPGSQRLIEYENKLNTFFPGSRCLAICQYDRRLFDASLLLQVLVTHPYAVIGVNLIENFYYTDPEEFLNPGLADRILDRRLSSLAVRKAGEEALQKSEERYRTIVETAQEGIWLLDADYRTVSVNDFMARMLGYTPAEMTGRPLTDFLHPDELKDHELVVAKRKKGIPGQFERLYKTRDGRNVWGLVSSTPMFRDGRFSGAFAMVTDITGRKQTESAVREANRKLHILSSITRHDILNQLMVLKGYLDISHEALDDPHTMREYLRKERRAVDIIESQITFTRDYQELGVSAPVWLNVNATVRKAADQLSLKGVCVDPGPADIEVLADPLFEKVCYNLIDNALRYGGPDLTTIRFFASEYDLGLTYICEDDGAGIDDEEKKLLFTPGYGKNTGLGLFLSREILSITGISITVTGEPGKGARFEMLVPKGRYRIGPQGHPI